MGDSVGKWGRISIFDKIFKTGDMTTFIGEHPCNVDVKGRILLPSALKKQMSSEAKEGFVVRKDIFEKCLVLYPMDEWEIQVKRIRSRLNPYNREHNKLLREFYKNTAELALDSANRILIPKYLMELIGASKEVMLHGTDNKIEIWSKEAYQMGITDEEDFAKRAEQFLGDKFENLSELLND
ncbi:MAG TPA: division/cell wall cluster transcriptional repressor MraZ [Bacteroidales bacterium]|nr:division/cell wall cluster transcriptional repressor MraZ [Bacteroidales bacterium]